MGWAGIKRPRGVSDSFCVKLLACKDCHAQYDVTSMAPGSAFDCRCGTALEATPPVGVDAPVERCSACGALAKAGDEVCDYCKSEIILAPRRGSLICPECMARNLDDARFCLACGIAFEPQSIPQNAPELRCPCCQGWMVVREVGGLVIQECPKCHGLWAPEDVFDALVDRASTIARERSENGDSGAPRVDGGNPAERRVEYRRCPNCDSMMGRRNFRKRSGVIIDRCHEHGTWLDANELERIAGFVLSGRAESAARIEAVEREAAGREQARSASRRAQLGGIQNRHEEIESSIFSSRRVKGGAETILDLLISILH